MVHPQQMTEDDFDMKGTSRKEYENEYYKRVCSEVIDDFLFLGSDFMARDESIFQQHGITHVINCSSDYSDNYQKHKGVVYKNYHLKDHVRENIESIFYDAIFFIEEVKRNNGKVYVHCVQGISRSATICIAYLIFDQKMTYQSGLNYITQRRQVANPNLTFLA